MLNKEKYKEEIFEIACIPSTIAIVDNKIVPCCKVDCAYCYFANPKGCYDIRVKWLNSEYVEPKITIPSDTPIDTKVLVSEDGIVWEKRHLKAVEKDIVFVWIDGYTSWSIPNKHSYCGFSYGKLAEE